MKKLALVVLSLLFIVTTANAQKGTMKIEPSLVLALPQDGTNMGFGINGTFFYGINNNIDLTGSLGYITWGYSDWDGDLTTIPVLFGARYSFGDKGGFTPYASAELGFHFMSFSMEIPSIWGTGTETYTSSSTEFGLGIGGGAYYKVGNITLDGNIQYNTMDGSFLSIEVGALFAL